ncbi:MAG: DegT/DnrJ/EryC1/StrS family aminotransferase, partial [Odoribacteraceae bacterium]|nr:DegT/DnrJ/EryC1/StrS family aminotransferase [Odoribacteraceae bacterium]
GYNYRMSNICAGIGRGQMEVLASRVARRRAINGLYREAFAGLDGIRLLTEPDAGFRSNHWLTAIIVDPSRAGGVTREDIRLACEAANIETRPWWKPMHLQPVFASAPFYGDGTSERLFRDGLCLPSGSSLADEEVARVAGIVKALVGGGR